MVRALPGRLDDAGLTSDLVAATLPVLRRAWLIEAGKKPELLPVVEACLCQVTQEEVTSEALLLELVHRHANDAVRESGVDINLTGQSLLRGIYEYLLAIDATQARGLEMRQARSTVADLLRGTDYAGCAAFLQDFGRRRSGTEVADLAAAAGRACRLADATQEAAICFSVSCKADPELESNSSLVGSGYSGTPA